MGRLLRILHIFEAADTDGDRTLSKDEVFARMEYFLVRVMPVADRWKVQMALHPDDPPMPVVRGVERWHYPVFEGCTCAPLPL